MTENVFRISSETDRFWCAFEARRFAQDLGFGERAQWELAIVVAELVSNAARYAGSGTLTLRASPAPLPGMEIVVADPGPRPAATAVDAASAAPASAHPGLGLGLRTVSFLSHQVSFERDPNGGTVVKAARFLRP
jgi:anti-sigma regulatory factor (Ser/Thr protein kinase)